MRFSLLSLALVGLLSSCQAQTAPMESASVPMSAAVSLAPASASNQIWSFDFNGPGSSVSSGASSNVAGNKPTARIQPEGTIDTRNGSPSGALTFGAKMETAKNARLLFSSGPLAVRNSQSNLKLLTLSFDLWISQLRPVRVRIQSLDAAGKISGSRLTTLYPPVSSAFYRFGIDLDKTRAESGIFNPLAPKMQVQWEISGADSPLPGGDVSLRVDNLTFSAPTLYVSATGNDGNDGKSEVTALATPQKAVEMAQPGDTILVMNGTYRAPTYGAVASINKAGQPAAWITLRAYPGHKPVFRGDFWNILQLTENAAYIEIRDLTVRGFRADYTIEDGLENAADKKGPDGKSIAPNSVFNTNGISVDARQGTEAKRAHHIRIIGNTVYENTGGGIPLIGSDYNTVEGNVVYDNCHLMRYAGSGISVFRGWNFDQTTGTKNFILGNISHGNRTYVPWEAVGQISDGNGIIIDDMINSQEGASKVPFVGRTLVQNNLSYGNGGSGIHSFASNHVDIINNTAFHNVQSPELDWRQISAAGECRDIRVRNNIWWAQGGKPLSFDLEYQSSDISYDNNVVWGDGDNDKKTAGGLGVGQGHGSGEGVGNKRVNPGFISPSLDPKKANFQLRPGSPARGAGAQFSGVPIVDINGATRSQISAGAYR